VETEGPLERSGRRWEGNIWTYLAQDRVRLWDFFEYGNEPSDSIKGGKFLD
jgi:hypothetical protein